MGKTHHNQLFYFYYITLFKSNALQYVPPLNALNPFTLEPLFKDLGHSLVQIGI